MILNVKVMTEIQEVLIQYKWHLIFDVQGRFFLDIGSYTQYGILYIQERQ